MTQNLRSVIIDDFENSSFTFQYWNDYSDSSSGGGTSTFFSTVDLPEHRSLELSFSYSLLKKDWKYSPYAGLIFKPGIETLPSSPLEAISYEFKGDTHTFNYIIHSVKDHSYHNKIIPGSSEWVTVTIKMSELKQPNWGAKIPFDYYDLKAFSWIFNGSDGEQGGICIDNLRFIYHDTIEKPTLSLIHFQEDSAALKIFAPENDSLFQEMKDYVQHKKEYLSALEKIRSYEKTGGEWLLTIQSSSLSAEKKQRYSELIFLLTNNIPGDVYAKAQALGTKELKRRLPLDSMYSLDRAYPRRLSEIRSINAWAKDLWYFATSKKIGLGFGAIPDSAFQKELEIYHFDSGETIAEIGVGTGFFEQAISKFCDSLTVYVNEVDSASVEKLKVKMALLDKYDGKSISYFTVLGNDSLSGLSPNSCDAIVIKNTFHHFSLPDKMLEDFKRALKPGGRLLIADIMKGEVDRNDCAYYMDRTTFMKWLTDAGFELVNENKLFYGKYFCFEFRPPLTHP